MKSAKLFETKQTKKSPNNVNFKILEENVTCIYYYCGISLKRLKKPLKKIFINYIKMYILKQHEETEQNDIFSRDTNL